MLAFEYVRLQHAMAGDVERLSVDALTAAVAGAKARSINMPQLPMPGKPSA